MINTSSGFSGVVSSILKIFDTAMPVLVALALMLFMVGVIRYIYSEGEHKNRELIMWSLIALFVMVSIWGIVRLMCASLTGPGSCGAKSGYQGGSPGTLPPLY